MEAAALARVDTVELSVVAVEEVVLGTAVKVGLVIVEVVETVELVAVAYARRVRISSADAVGMDLPTEEVKRKESLLSDQGEISEAAALARISIHTA